MRLPYHSHNESMAHRSLMRGDPSKLLTSNGFSFVESRLSGALEGRLDQIRAARPDFGINSQRIPSVGIVLHGTYVEYTSKRCC